MLDAIQFTDESKDRIFHYMRREGFWVEAIFDNGEAILKVRSRQGWCTTKENYAFTIYMSHWLLKSFKGDMYFTMSDKKFKKQYEIIELSKAEV